MDTDKVLTFIDEKGALLAEKLNVAVPYLYDKVLMYIRIKGIINLVTALLVLLILSPFVYLTFKADWSRTDGEAGSALLFLWFVSFGILFFIVRMVVYSVAQVIAPEFYLIDQVVNNMSD